MASRLTINEYVAASWHIDGALELLLSPRGLYSLAVALVAVLTSIAWMKMRDPYPEVPGPKPHFFLGNLSDCLTTPYIYCHLAWRNTYGTVYKVRYFMSDWALVFTDPELVKEVLVKHAKVFHDRIMDVPHADLDRRGLLMSQGGYWQGLRNAMLPMFHAERLRKFSLVMNRTAATLTRKLGAFADLDRAVDVSALVYRMTTDVILETSFGMSFDVQEGSPATTELVSSFHSRMQCTLDMRTSRIVSMLVPAVEGAVYWIAEQLPWTADYAYGRSRRNIQRFVRDLVRERSGSASGNGAGEGEERHDFFSMLLRARNKDSGRKLKDEEIGAAISEFLLAGLETTALAVGYCIFILSRHRAAEAKVTQEIDSFFERITKQEPQEDEEAEKEMRPRYEELSEFPYLEMVLNESLRLYPPAPILTRQANQAIDVGGYKLKKGARIYVPVYTMLHDDTLFPDPYSFNPERFAPGVAEKEGRHPYAFIPFGAGPHTCIGMRFAMEEVKLTLIHLYKHFTFSIDESKLKDGNLDLVALITVKPKDGVHVFVHRRK